MKDYQRITKDKERQYVNFMWKSDDYFLKIYNRLADLESKIESGEIDYVVDKDAEISRLQAEVAELRARLEKAVELPRVECIKTWEWLNRERLGDIMLEWCVLYKKGGWLVVEPCLSKEAAEARLKEMQGGER